MDRETANTLIRKLWMVQEQLTSIHRVVDAIEQVIADDVEGDV